MVVLMTVLMSFMSSGQSLGKLKLGMSINDIPELKEADTTSSPDTYTYKIFRSTKKSSIWEILRDTVNNSNYHASLSKNVRIFYIGSIKISSNISIEQVELKFYDDSLYYIVCESNRTLEEALKTKYLEPKIEVKETPNEYTNGYGNKIIKTDVSYTTTYFEKDNITLHSYLSKSFSTYSQDFFYFNKVLLYNNKITEIVTKQEEIVKARIEKRKEESKKKQFADF